MILLLGFLFLIYAIYSLQHESHIPYLISIMYILNSVRATFEVNFEILRLGSIILYPSDIVIIIMLGILLFRGIKIYKTKFDLLLGLSLFFLLGSTIIGLFINGVTFEFIGEFRRFYYFIVPVLYFYNRGLHMSKEKLVNYFDRFMNVILIYCGVCWFSNLVLGIPLTNFENGSLRVISSDYAIVVAIYTLCSIYRDLFIAKTGRIKFRTSLFIVVLIILQFNSIWMSTLAGSVSLIIIKHKEIILRRPIFVLQIIASLIGIMLVLFFFSNTSLIQTILFTVNKFNDVGNETGTFGTREAVWKGLLDSLNGVEWLVGQTFGTGYYVWYINSYWSASPHSGYIEGLMRIGLLGMTCWIGFMLFLIKKCVINKQGTALGAVIIVAILVYWVPYSFTFECGAFVGCIAHFLRNRNLFKEDNLVLFKLNKFIA